MPEAIRDPAEDDEFEMIARDVEDDLDATAYAVPAGVPLATPVDDILPAATKPKRKKKASTAKAAFAKQTLPDRFEVAVMIGAFLLAMAGQVASSFMLPAGAKIVGEARTSMDYWQSRLGAVTPSTAVDPPGLYEPPLFHLVARIVDGALPRTRFVDHWLSFLATATLGAVLAGAAYRQSGINGAACAAILYAVLPMSTIWGDGANAESVLSVLIVAYVVLTLHLAPKKSVGIQAALAVAISMMAWTGFLFVLSMIVLDALRRLDRPEWARAAIVVGSAILAFTASLLVTKFWFGVHPFDYFGVYRRHVGDQPSFFVWVIEMARHVLEGFGVPVTLIALWTIGGAIRSVFTKGRTWSDALVVITFFTFLLAIVVFPSRAIVAPWAGFLLLAPATLGIARYMQVMTKKGHGAVGALLVGLVILHVLGPRSFPT